jgi:deoxyhypusine monooxygenase
VKKNNHLSMLNLSQAELGALEASLLNLSGNVPLHNRFRALFTLKALKSDEAVRIISKGAARPLRQ